MSYTKLEDIDGRLARGDVVVRRRCIGRATLRFKVLRAWKDGMVTLCVLPMLRGEEPVTFVSQMRDLMEGYRVKRFVKKEGTR